MQFETLTIHSFSGKPCALDLYKIRSKYSMLIELPSTGKWKYFDCRQLCQTAGIPPAEFHESTPSQLISRHEQIVKEVKTIAERAWKDYRIAKEALVPHLLQYALFTLNGRTRLEKTLKKLQSLSNNPKALMNIACSGYFGKKTGAEPSYLSDFNGRLHPKTREPIGEGGCSRIFAAGEQKERALSRAKEINQALQLLNHTYVSGKLRHPNIISSPEFVLFSQTAQQRPKLNALSKRYLWQCADLIGNSAIPGRQILNICLTSLLGLEALHKAGYIHIDFKVENLLLTADPKKKAPLAEAVLIDFGASVQEGELSKSGTEFFYTPEQRNKDYTARRAVDIFMHGIATMEMAATKEAPPEYWNPASKDYVFYGDLVRQDCFSEHIRKVKRAIYNNSAFSSEDRYIRLRLADLAAEQMEPDYQKRPSLEPTLKKFRAFKKELEAEAAGTARRAYLRNAKKELS